MSKSTTSQTATKPRPDAPPFLHKTGRWCKKVRGRFVYFGYAKDDPDGSKALESWREQKTDLLAGRTPRPKSDELTIRELCDRFMVSKRAKMDSGELTAASFGDYFATCKRIIDQFGKARAVADLRPEDFQKFRACMAKGWSPVTLANEIQRIRVVFNYGEVDHGVKVNFGSEFSRPPRKIMRKARRARGKRMFEADELRKIIGAASIQLKAMLLLAANAGLGNSDCANLKFSHLDLDRAWLDYPRPKTEVSRKCPLWAETVAALRAAIAARPAPKSADLTSNVFVTKYGGRWGNVTLHEADPENGKEASVSSDDPICKEMSKLLATLGLKRKGLNFYGIRHGFETVAGKRGDQGAVDVIMGHDRNDMASVYREESNDERLKQLDNQRLLAVVTHVHEWLYPAPPAAPAAV